MKIKKSQRNSRFFFHRMGLIFFFLPLLILVLGIVLPDRGFSEKENRVLASAPGLKLNQLTSGGFKNSSRLTKTISFLSAISGSL